MGGAAIEAWRNIKFGQGVRTQTEIAALAVCGAIALIGLAIALDLGGRKSPPSGPAD